MNMDDAAQAVTGSTTMMQDYRASSPGGVATKILSYAAQDGTLHIVSLNNDNNVYHTCRRTDGTEGWIQNQVALPAGAVTDIALVHDVAGPRLFTFITSGSTSGGNIFVSNMVEAVLGPDGTPGAPVQIVAGLWSTNGVYNLSGFAAAPNTPASAVYGGTDFITPPTNYPSYVMTIDQLSPSMQVQVAFDSATDFFPQVSTTNPIVEMLQVAGSQQAWPTIAFLSLYQGALSYNAGVGQVTTPNGLRYLNLNSAQLTSQTALVDFDVASADGVNFTMVAVDGSAAMYTCTFTAGAPPSVTWSAQPLTGTATPSFTKVQLSVRPDGDLDAALVDANGGLWLTASAANAWQEAAQVLPPRIADVCTFSASVDGSGFMSADQAGNIVLHTRNAQLEWRRETVELEGDEVVSDVAVYRVALTLDGTSDASRELPDVVLTSSARVPAVLNGSPLFLDPIAPTTIPAGGAGELFVDIELTDNIAAPTLTFSSPRFSAPAVVEPHQAVTQYIKTVSSGDLGTGVDPRTNTPLVPSDFNNPADLEHLQSALNQIGNIAATYREPEAAFLNRSWKLGVRDGGLSFHLVEHGGDERAFLAPQAAGSFLGVDWADAWDAVTGGFAKVVDVIVDAGRATVTFLINGANYIASALLDAADKIYDLVTGVFDMIGTILGTVLGWLLKVLGFLFDWDKILGVRDRLKAQVTAAFSGLQGQVTDPNIGAATVNAQIQELRTSIAQVLASYNASPAGSKTLVNFYGPIPSVASFFTVGSSSVLKEATWVIDKLKGALPDFSTDFGLPDVPGLADAMAALPAAIANFSDSLFAFAGQAWLDVLSNWFESLEALTNGNFDPILAIVGQQIDAVCAALQGLVTAFAQVLHTLWAGGAQIAAWLNQTIYFPFFSAFYKAVVESDLSILDLVCLGAAIPMSLGVGAKDRAAATPNTDAVSGLLSIGILTRALAAFVEANADTRFNKRAVTLSGLLDSAVAISAAIIMVYTDEWKYPGTIEIIGAGLATVFSLANYTVAGYVAAGLGMLFGLLGRVFMSYTWPGFAFILASCVQYFVTAGWFAFAVPPPNQPLRGPGSQPPRPPGPHVRLGYVAAHTILSTILAATYIADTQRDAETATA
jgi:hypothetical protein